MAIAFPCASCGRPLKAAERLAGRMVKFPNCGGSARVPSPAPAGDPEIRILEELPAAGPRTEDPAVEHAASDPRRFLPWLLGLALIPLVASV